MKNAKLLMAITAVWLVIPACLFAQPRQDTLFIDMAGEYPIYKHLYIHETYKKLDAAFVYYSLKPNQFIKLYPKKSFNNTTSLIPYYWLVTTVKNNLPHDETFYYWMNSAGLSKATIYRKTNQGNFQVDGVSGFYVPVPKRQNKGHDVEFRFLIHKGETNTILLLIENPRARNAFFYPQLSDSDFFWQEKENYYAVMGTIFGIMFTAFLLNIFFAITLKENIHYLYAAYIAALLYEMFNLEGIAADYWGRDSGINELITHVFPAICLLLMTRVMQWFLQQKRNNSYLKLPLTIVNSLVVFDAFAYFINYFFHFPASVTNILQIIQATFIMLQLLLVVASAVEKTIQGYRLAWLYLVAMIWPFVGLFEYGFAFLGFNDIGLIKKRHPNDLQIGLVVEAVVVFIAIIYRYNLYKKEKEILLTEAAGQQVNLVKRIVAAEEEERKRIAEDLHDDVGATLNTLNLHISNIPEKWQANPDLKQYHDRGLALSNKVSNDVRSIAHNLLPKDFRDIGLFTALENRVQELNLLTNIRFSLIAEGDGAKLNDVFSIIVYRIINELLTNIVKHSIASETTVQLLIAEKEVQIMAEDDGIGFDKTKVADGIGLRNIQGRIEFLKGTLQIDTGRNGTHSIIHLPL